MAKNKISKSKRMASVSCQYSHLDQIYERGFSTTYIQKCWYAIYTYS